MGDILGLVAKRLGLGLVILLIISVIIFFMVELLPGDIAQAVLGQGATPENLARYEDLAASESTAPVEAPPKPRAPTVTPSARTEYLEGGVRSES